MYILRLMSELHDDTVLSYQTSKQVINAIKYKKNYDIL